MDHNRNAAVVDIHDTVALVVGLAVEVAVDLEVEPVVRDLAAE